MRIVLSGYYGFHNVGDEAILYSIISALKKVEPTIEIVVLSNDPTFTKDTYGVEAVNRWKLKEVIGAIKNSDGLISGGGSLLQDKTGNKSVIYYSGVMLIAKLLGKPFVVYAQGIGPVDKKQNQWITKFALSKAAFLSVRDQASKGFLEKLGLKNQMALVPDPVLGIAVANEASTVAQSYDNYISVSVRDWPSTVDYLAKIAKVLDQLVSRGYQIVFVPMHGEHDAKTSEKVQEMMGSKSVVAPFDLSIEEKITVIGQSQLLIGMRLHALIFAAVKGTPFTAISYDPKIDAFSKLSQQPVAVHVNEENWTEETLLTTVEDQLSHLPIYKKNVKKYADQAKIEAQKTAEIALQTFNSFK